jgi:hypothetical protein
MAAFFVWIQMVKDEHVRVVYIASFPFTMFGFKVIMYLHSIPMGIGFIALIISSRISPVMLIVNLVFASATVGI